MRTNGTSTTGREANGRRNPDPSPDPRRDPHRDPSRDLRRATAGAHLRRLRRLNRSVPISRPRIRRAARPTALVSRLTNRADPHRLRAPKLSRLAAKRPPLECSRSPDSPRTSSPKAMARVPISRQDRLRRRSAADSSHFSSSSASSSPGESDGAQRTSSRRTPRIRPPSPPPMSRRAPPVMTVRLRPATHPNQQRPNRRFPTTRRRRSSSSLTPTDSWRRANSTANGCRS